MFPRRESHLCKASVGIDVTGNDDQVNVHITKEAFWAAVVLRLWEINRAMLSMFNVGGWVWSLCSLQESIDLQVLVGQYEWQVEGCRAEAVADDSYFDGRHD